MSSPPAWTYDFNRRMYFFLDRNRQRVYANDPRVINQRTDDPRSIPQQSSGESREPDPSHYSVPEAEAYAATPQPPQSRQPQAMARAPLARTSPTPADAQSGPIPGFQALNLSTARPDHQQQQQQQQPQSSVLLRNEFQPRDKPRRFFTEGKVFMALWNEGTQVDRGTVMSDKAYSRNGYNEWVYSKTRRFIVVKPGTKSCVAVPITTNNRQGAAKKGERKSDYCIVYSGKSAPPQNPDERPSYAGEAPMQPQAIKLDIDDQGEKLDSMSRINLAEPQTIQHYYKVKPVGKVNPKSMASLTYQHRLVMYASATPVAPGVRRDPVSTRHAASASDEHIQSREAAEIKVLRMKGYTLEQAREILSTLRSSRQSREHGMPAIAATKQAEDAGENDEDDDEDDDEDAEQEGDESSSGDAEVQGTGHKTGGPPGQGASRLK